MKKYLILLALPFIFMSCNTSATKEKPFELLGEINGYEEGPIYLQKREKGRFITIDSTMTENGRFRFSGNLEHPLFAYLKLEGQPGFITLFVEPGQVNLKANVENLNEPRVSGSESQYIYESFLEISKEFDEKLKEIYSRYLEAEKTGDEDYMNDLDAYYNQVEADKKEHIVNFIKANAHSSAAAFITLRNIYMLNLNDLNDIVDVIDPALSESQYVVDLNNRVEKLRNVQVGMPAPDFVMNDTLGNPVALSSFFGNYLFVDFWASWCGPCRRANPDKVAAFKKYHDNGLDFVGVSLDTDRERWIKAIHDDGLTWNHVSDLAGWNNEAANLYAVSSIPSNVLLDPQGIIIARNLKGKDIEKKLQEVFAQQTASK